LDVGRSALMRPQTPTHVAVPPPKPLLIWDGECLFCRRWIERWRDMTAGEVDYANAQEVAEKFPEISREDFERSVVLIEPDGQTYCGAEAVYRSLRCRSSKRWLAWSYNHLPGFAQVSEFFYRIIARHRRSGSAVTRFLWGDDVRPPTYFWAQRWFLRALGLIYLVAFVSLWVQVDGLIGADGIWPIKQVLPATHDQLGAHAYWLLPTLCWFNTSNALLHFLCGGGVVLSILLVFGIARAISLVGLFVFYLSLTIAGQAFLSFQWDILLLETGFLSIFVAPWRLWWTRANEPPVSRAALFLLKLLLFKLLLMSGVVKLTSGDDSWWQLTALDYHYWSQPLPTVFAWYADKSPEWFKHFSVAFCLVVEIIVPFFIWAPRRLRLIAAALFIVLQIAIAITGNYCFFNLLTIALSLWLIDDSVTLRHQVANTATQRRGYNGLSAFAAIGVIVVTLPLNGWLIFTAFRPEAEWPRPLAIIYSRLEAFRIVNGYGLFRVMTKDREEIVIEGSADGIDWHPYEFKWKPGNMTRAPGWCAPHQPRLDWQMWFAALGTPRQNPWFIRTLICLLQGKRDVVQLLETNPFPEKPPRYVRALFYRYRFTTMAERQQTGAWWQRQELREYVPAFSLDQMP
jgi:predicted DCC family thiol-disulfide oxidoreductase YuxK